MPIFLVGKPLPLFPAGSFASPLCQPQHFTYLEPSGPHSLPPMAVSYLFQFMSGIKLERQRTHWQRRFIEYTQDMKHWTKWRGKQNKHNDILRAYYLRGRITLWVQVITKWIVHYSLLCATKEVYIVRKMKAVQRKCGFTALVLTSPC